MTEPPPTPPDAACAPTPGVAALPPEATGYWVVQTARTTHVFDFDQATYTRIPDVGRKAMPYDRQSLALCEVLKAPHVGGQFLVYVDALDADGQVVDQMWRVSATITRVMEVDPAAAEELLQRP
jgi:hypothetical protein